MSLVLEHWWYNKSSSCLYPGVLVIFYTYVQLTNILSLAEMYLKKGKLLDCVSLVQATILLFVERILITGIHTFVT